MSGTTPSCANPQNGLADAPEAGLHLVGDAECAGRARSGVRRARYPGGTAKMPSLENTSSQIRSAGPCPAPRSRAKASSTSSATSSAASGAPSVAAPPIRATQGSSAAGPSSSGERAAVAAVVPW